MSWKILVVAAVVFSNIIHHDCLKVYIDGKYTPRWKLPTLEGMNSLYRKAGNALDYIQGSRTADNLRYGKRGGSFPFQFTFSDRYNRQYRVIMESKNDNFYLFFPTGSSTYWYGADSSPTRTGSDAQTHWAQVQFSYLNGGWLGSNGVRINFNGYKTRNTGEWLVDYARWDKILELTHKGVEISADVLEQVETVATMGKKPKVG